jgi:hypothetical protein
MLYIEDAQPRALHWGTAHHINMIVHATVHPYLRLTLSSIQIQIQIQFKFLAYNTCTTNLCAHMS